MGGRFTFSLYGIYRKRLIKIFYYIVKSEDREFNSPLMRDLFAGSVAALTWLKLVGCWMNSIRMCLKSPMDPEMKEKLQKLEAENSVTAESLMKV